MYCEPITETAGVDFRKTLENLKRNKKTPYSIQQLNSVRAVPEFS